MPVSGALLLPVIKDGMIHKMAGSKVPEGVLPEEIHCHFALSAEPRRIIAGLPRHCGY
jgi:hypothetical protein